MKALTQFLKFDWESFAKDKRFLVAGSKEWLDFHTKVHCGTKIEVMIAEDKTTYRQKEGEQVSNLFEKVTFKCKKDVSIPLKATVVPVNVVATVYGEYRNMLSIECDDIRVIQPVKA